MKYPFPIPHRWRDAAVFTAEIPLGDDQPYSLRLGAAVKVAVEARADLTDANLAGAYLAGADLAGAYLVRAYLAGADLTDANLAGAYLADADLADADLGFANLTRAYLARANLTGANLTGANLTCAYLTDANLTGASLARANLTGHPAALQADAGVPGYHWRFSFVRAQDGTITVHAGCRTGDCAFRGLAAAYAHYRSHTRPEYGRAVVAMLDWAATQMQVLGWTIDADQPSAALKGGPND